jgi:hypothetical protein
MTKWKTWPVVVVLLISGITIGSASATFYFRHRIGGMIHEGPLAMRRFIMKRITSELDLTKDQQYEISDIVDETQYQLHQLHEQYRPQMEKIIDAGIAEMKTNLTEEQQRKLDAFYDKMKKQWSLRRRTKENSQ